MSYAALVEQPKTIAHFPDWQRGENAALWFDAPLEIGGFTEMGLFLHGEARSDMPNRNVGFEITYVIPNSKRRFALQRLDWESWKGSHTNPRKSGWPLRGKKCLATHIYPFALNWVEGSKKFRKGDLPVATNIDGELQTFEQARASAGFFLGISNIELVKRPPWDYTGGYGGLDPAQ